MCELNMFTSDVQFVNVAIIELWLMKASFYLATAFATCKNMDINVLSITAYQCMRLN